LRAEGSYDREMTLAMRSFGNVYPRVSASLHVSGDAEAMVLVTHRRAPESPA
jgi:hypothetical protein